MENNEVNRFREWVASESDERMQLFLNELGTYLEVEDYIDGSEFDEDEE